MHWNGDKTLYMWPNFGLKHKSIFFYFKWQLKAFSISRIHVSESNKPSENNTGSKYKNINGYSGIPQSRTTAFPKHQMKARWGPNDDKTEATYETCDARTNKNCNKFDYMFYHILVQINLIHKIISKKKKKKKKKKKTPTKKQVKYKTTWYFHLCNIIIRNYQTGD